MGIKVTRDNTMITCRIVNKKGVLVTTHPLLPPLFPFGKKRGNEEVFSLSPSFLRQQKRGGRG
jgi:hypothetical protein